MSGPQGQPFHQPALLRESLELLQPRNGGCYLDGTVGGGGHARAILEASAPEGRLYGLDQDREALAEAGRVLAGFGERAVLIEGNFARAAELLPEVSLDGALLDLGVSSHQLDTAARGFSCDRPGPLDMRMSQSLPEDAATLLDRLDEAGLAEAIRAFGESRFSRRLAREILRRRQSGALTDTAELAATVRASVPRPMERKTVILVFQALRILVNRELECLPQGLEGIFSLLRPGGRLAVISYHSLEDRIVKRFFAALVNPCTCPPSLPQCVCGKRPQLRLVTRGALQPTAEEVAENPRSRSAKLRVAEKLPAAAGARR